MSTEGFPTDAYTPHGYLANPHAFARSWSDGHGGNLRSTREAVGFGWLYPWARDASAGAQIELGVDDAVCRADFERMSTFHAPRHSSLLFEYTWMHAGLDGRARFVLLGQDELGLEVEIESGVDGEDRSAGGRDTVGAVTLYIAAVGWRADRGQVGSEASDAEGRIDLGAGFPAHRLTVDAGTDAAHSLGTASSLGELVGDRRPSRPRPGDQSAVAVAVRLTVPAGTRRRVSASLRRERHDGTAPERSGQGDLGEMVRRATASARLRDDPFWEAAARLVGDSPDAWRCDWV